MVIIIRHLLKIGGRQDAYPTVVYGDVYCIREATIYLQAETRFLYPQIVILNEKEKPGFFIPKLLFIVAPE
jgi:hypothetical protein